MDLYKKGLHEECVLYIVSSMVVAQVTVKHVCHWRSSKLRSQHCQQRKLCLLSPDTVQSLKMLQVVSPIYLHTFTLQDGQMKVVEVGSKVISSSSTEYRSPIAAAERAKALSARHAQDISLMTILLIFNTTCLTIMFGWLSLWQWRLSHNKLQYSSLVKGSNWHWWGGTN